MINNIEKISKILTPLEKGDFYFILILKRKKDNPELKGDSKVIKSYYVDFGQSLLDVEESIVRNCKENNARAYIYLQKRNWFKINLRMISTLSQELANGTVRNTRDLLDSICGQYASDDNKYWIIDVDTIDVNERDKTNSLLMKTVDENIVLLTVRTVNGYHIITKPFNPSLYEGKWEIKKQGMTLLYFNN